jgi:hypothetical protein
MSQFPWPEDVYAVARLDWCRSEPLLEGGKVAQMMCNNLARQCGSFTNATGDYQRIKRTAPRLQELLEGAEVQHWQGACPVAHARATGVCALGGATSHQEELWTTLAQPRQDQLYRDIGTPTVGEPAGPNP